MDKKALILAIKPKSKMEDEVESEDMGEMESEDEVSPAKLTAAQEILNAMESKDAKALAEAFSNMIQICSEYED